MKKQNINAYKKLKQFLEKYKDTYDPKMLEFIQENFDQYLTSKEAPDVIKQIYAELNILKKEDNLYLACLGKIKELYDINSNILEIGCGAFPILSKYIDEIQTNGSITAFDRYLATTNLNNIKLYNRNLTENDSVKNFDLLVGIWPCEATILLIKKANEANKDFFLAPCKCTHFSQDYLRFNLPSLEDWDNFVYNFARTSISKDKTIEVDYLEDGYNFKQKIIYTRKK